VVSANLLEAPIEELDLPMRAYNSLKRNNITKIGQLLALGDDELLRMRNFGKKSLDEMRERLALRGFSIPETGAGDASDEADLPASAELDEAVAAELDREG
jgi:DNA-directed RNA polymerase subunit alpha